MLSEISIRSLLSSSLYGLLAERCLVVRLRHGQKAPQIREGVLGSRHLAQMILPHVRLDGSPSEWLSGHLDHFTFSIDAGIGCRGDDKTDPRPCPPIGSCEVMRKEQSVIATFGRKYVQSLFRPRPNRIHVCLVPVPELESVKLSLIE